MKITQEHQDEYEKLITAVAIRKGATDLSDFIDKARLSIERGLLPRPRKSEAVFILSLLKSEALNFIVDVMYQYAFDGHIHTMQEKIFKKHAK